MTGETIEAFRRARQIPGLSVALLREGTVVHAAGYGSASAETVYQTASTGKQFTGALVLLARDRGLLALDDPIALHLGEAPATWSGITVRHLLTHTSGLSDSGYFALDFTRDYGDERIFDAIASAPLLAAPGDRWSYSNAGYVLLGFALGRLTGRFYGKLLKEWIFDPLEMTTARVMDGSGTFRGYRLVDGRPEPAEYVSPSLNRLADGSVLASVLDLARWDRALDSGVPRRHELWTPARLNDGAPCAYGMGWSLADTPRGRLAEHDGGWQGFSSHIARWLDARLTAIVLADLADVPAGELAHSLLA